MTNILCLDLGTKCGWAVSINGDITSGTENFKPVRQARFEGGGMCFLRFKKFLTELKNMTQENELDEIHFEEVRRHLGVDAAHKYGGYLGILSAWAEHHSIPYAGVPVGTIKKHLTGKGNANKEMMIESIRDMGFNPCDDNEADALALMDYITSI